MNVTRMAGLNLLAFAVAFWISLTPKQTQAELAGLVAEAGTSPQAAATPSPAKEQTIKCTPGHPVWVVGEGFVEAKDLRPGQLTLDAEGNEVEITGVEVRDEVADHYNFEVEDFHTYFVSGAEDAPAIWVHNSCFDRWERATDGQFPARRRQKRPG